MAPFSKPSRTESDFRLSLSQQLSQRTGESRRGGAGGGLGLGIVFLGGFVGFLGGHVGGLDVGYAFFDAVFEYGEAFADAAFDA